MFEFVYKICSQKFYDHKECIFQDYNFYGSLVCNSLLDENERETVERGKIYSFSNQETVERGKIYTPNKHLVRKDIDVNEH
jgi:hypothetical protein